MRYFLKKKKQVKECECAPCDCGATASASPAAIDADLSIGMGPVRIGGPDKFDNIIGVGTFPNHNVKIKKFKIKNKK